MKKIKILVILLGMFLATGCKTKEVLSEVKTYENIKYQETNIKTDKVAIYIENNDPILIELYNDVAPITVKNFGKLVETDFYNDTIFHRIIKDFVVQGGDGTPLGRKATTIKGEFTKNGVENNLKHERGVLSMARTNVNDSASSQFFIVLKDNPSLDGSYATFGRVIAGMNVVDKLGSVVTDSSDKPIKDIKMTNMEFIKVVSENE